MRVRDFAATRRRLFELYGASDYQAAMELARAAATDFPEREDQTSYWIACLHALQGNADAALDVLRRALDRGMWWAPELLETDPDLEPLRADGRLAEVISASGEARGRWKPNLPTAPVVLSTAGSRSPRAAVILLHARGSRPKTSSSYGGMPRTCFSSLRDRASPSQSMPRAGTMRLVRKLTSALALKRPWQGSVTPLRS